MALQVKKGTFLTNAVSTSIVVTGVGFVPKGIIVWGQDFTAVGTNANGHLSMGFASASGINNQGVSWFRCIDNVATTDTFRSWLDDSVLLNAIGAEFRAVLTSFDSDGFTLTQNVADDVAHIYHYVAIGGDGVNVKAKVEAMPTATGNASFTGYGFTPKAILLLSASRQTLGQVVTAKFSLGAGVSSSKRWSVCANARDAQTMTANVDAMKSQRTDAILQGLTDTATQDFLADLVSLGSDGYTLNFSDAPPAAYDFVALAIGGDVEVDLGSANSPTAGGTPQDQSITGLTFQPKLALFETFGEAATTSIIADAEAAFGGAASAADEGVTWMNEEDAVLPSQAGSYFATDRSITMRDSSGTGGAQTLLADAEFKQFDPTGFTVTWQTINATARQWLWLVLGEPVSLVYANPPPLQHLLVR